MPFLALNLKCSMKGITKLQPNDLPRFRWHLKLRCTNCGEAPEHWQYVVAGEEFEMPGGKGEANLVEKCKLCGRVNTLKLLTDSFESYKIEKNEKLQPLITFDCRGVEPFDFDPRNDWIAEGAETGTPFTDVDLTEKEWADYDEKANQEVEISEMSVEFLHVKNKK